MDWKQWKRACEILETNNIKPLIGVIPFCHDPKLNKCEPIENFWEYIKLLEARGYTIAMHGYKHVYRTKERGMVGVAEQSEFAGLPYEEQYKCLQRAKKIFDDHEIDVKIFFAPSHSYDKNTLKALSQLGFRWISDGKSLKAYNFENLTLLPCISGGIPKIFFTKYITVVIHTHEWSISTKEKEYERFRRFCEKFNSNIVDFEEYARQPIGCYVSNSFIERNIVKFQRNILPILVKTKRLLCNSEKRVLK